MADATYVVINPDTDTPSYFTGPLTLTTVMEHVGGYPIRMIALGSAGATMFVLSAAEHLPLNLGATALVKTFGSEVESEVHGPALLAGPPYGGTVRALPGDEVGAFVTKRAAFTGIPANEENDGE